MAELKILGIVVTYYPSIDELLTNVGRYINDIDKLIIWQNTPIEHRCNYKIDTKQFDWHAKIILAGNDNNIGMSVALNYAVNWAFDNSFDLLLTMDQDSYWVNFPLFKNEVLKLYPNERINIFAPNANNRYPSLEEDFITVPSTITSGSIFKVVNFKTVGLFDEKLFIDAVDLAFCYRSRRKNLDTIIVPKAILNQQFGDTNPQLFFNKTVHTSNYSSFRLYYIVRNHIWLWRNYPELDKEQKRKILTEYTSLRIIKIMLYESNKLEKIWAICKGITHGLFMK